MGDAEMARVGGLARRHETAGGLVWHEWGEGQPLVLLHGAAGSWRHWLRNVEAFAAHRRVLAADLPGFGESALPPAPVTLGGIAGLIGAGLDALIGAAPFELAGFSLGASIAGQVAQDRGAQVARLTLVGAGGLTVANFIEMERVRDKQGAARLAAHRENLRRIMIHDPGRIDAPCLAAQAWNSDHARLRARGVIPPLTLARLLPGIPAPVDAIWGEFDQPAAPDLAQRIAALRALRPEARITVIPGAGHWVAFEAAAAFNAAMLAPP